MERKINFSIPFFIVIITIPYLIGCNKAVQIKPPANTITSSEVFADSTDANSAIAGIYKSLSYGDGSAPIIGNGLTTIINGLSSDELVAFINSPGYSYTNIYTNSIIANNTAIYAYWSFAYKIIYQANACITGIQSSATLSASVKSRLTAEAKFLRALCYFYLINEFGDVPYVTSVNYPQTAIAPKTPATEIYTEIIADLKQAQKSLPANSSYYNNGERTRATQWAATALLSRVYLYMKDWSDAEQQATSIIQSGNFNLEANLNNVFLTTSTEAILQWETNGTTYPYNVTVEGFDLIPAGGNKSQPNYYLSTFLLNNFEPGDLRRQEWIDSTIFRGTVYYYPFKYKVVRSFSPTTPATEYYTVLRLAEQYLIRAEAKANLGDGNATADLNIIRNRAGLPSYNGATDKSSLLSAIYHERQIEFFAEWGHRWLDLKRTGQVDSVMSIITPKKGGGIWSSYKQLYPIPLTDIQFDPNLSQNPGY